MATLPAPSLETPPVFYEVLWWVGVGLLTIGALSWAAAWTVMWLSDRGHLDPYYGRPAAWGIVGAIGLMTVGALVTWAGQSPPLPSSVNQAISAARWATTIAGLTLLAAGVLLVRHERHGTTDRSLGWPAVITGALLIALTLILEAIR